MEQDNHHHHPNNPTEQSSSLSSPLTTLPLPSSHHHCDRRLSRIARSFIQTEILPILTLYSSTSNPTPTPNPTTSLLQEIIDNAGTASQCDLSPSRDIYAVQEQGVRQLTSPSRRSNSPQEVFQCGICQKQFVSRYYLDLHMEHHHPIDHHDHDHDHVEDDDYWICPATDLCPKLTGDLYGCDEIAERTDPHYGPGSGRSTSTTIQPSPKTKISCQESLMKHSQQQCYQLFHDCFAPFSETLVHELTVSICDRLTCTNKIHRLAQWESSSVSPKNDLPSPPMEDPQLHSHSHPKEVWDHHVNFRLGFGGGFILLFVMSAFVSLSTLGGGLEYDKKKRRKRRKMLRLRNQKLKTI